MTIESKVYRVTSVSGHERTITACTHVEAEDIAEANGISVFSVEFLRFAH